MFDFGGVVDGYSSDFGRTIYCGEPPTDYLEAYDVMLAAQEAGRAAAKAGTPAREVNAACRAPIEDAGLGEHFRHRMGHCIGMDVHERPFISNEDETPLEAGMTFTDEPSIIIPGRYSLRIEDILVCEEGGGRSLNSYPAALVANGCSSTPATPATRRRCRPSCRPRPSDPSTTRRPASAGSAGRTGRSG